MTSLPRLKARVKTLFPSSVIGANGTSVTKENGGYTIGPSYSELDPIIDGTDLSTLRVRVLDTSSGGYAAATLQDVADTIGLTDLETEVTGNLGVSHLDSGTNASVSTFWNGSEAWLPADTTKVRVVSGVSSEQLVEADIGSVIIVDTFASPSQGEITTYLPALSSLSGDSLAPLTIKKFGTETHSGKVTVSPPIITSTTGSIGVGATSLTVADATGVAIGQLCVAIGSGTFRQASGLKNNTFVSNVSGTTITLSKNTTEAITDGTFHFYDDTIDGGPPRAFEIHGQSITLNPDIDNGTWTVLSQQMSTIGTPITGHHVVGSPYSVASPWDGDPSTANTQMWEFIPESAGGDIKINMPPPAVLVQGYNPAVITMMRADTYAGHYPRIYTPGSTWNQANTPVYPFTLNDFGDIIQVYTDEDEYRTINEYDAHKSWINNIRISGTTSPRTSNTLTSAASTIYAVPYLGDHIYLPGSPAGSVNFVWQNRRVQGTLSHLLSSSTYGYAASANAVHNAYITVGADNSLQLFLGAANAGSSEYTKLDGVNVNASALPGNVAAKSARLVAFVTTNGSSQATYISDEVIAPTQFTGRVGINAAPPTSASGLTVKISTVPGDGYSSIGLTDDSTYTASIQSDAGGTRLKHVNSAPLYFGTNNTDRLIVAADGGIYTNNATSGSRGIDTINAKGVYVDAQAVSVAKATTQVFTSGSGTYTTPAGVKWIEVFLVGGGGGGGGSGTGAGGGTGGNGGSTTFSTLTASGGAGGTGAGAAGNAGGGTGTGGSINVTGGAGGGGSGSGTGTTVPGVGGASKWFGTTPTPAIGGNAGLAAPANTGTGGSGASIATSGPVGTGGAGGGYVYAIINSPAASYSYAVGAAGTAGTAGTSGAAGGAGGSGIVQVIEHY